MTGSPLYRDEWPYVWEEVGVAVTLSHLRESSSEVHAEVVVQAMGPNGWGHLHGPVRLNLLSTQSRTSLAKFLKSRSPEGVQWDDLLEIACTRTIREWRQGAPFLRLRDVPVRGPEEELITGMFPAGETSMVYGDGGSLKSAFALAVALSVITGVPIARGLDPGLLGPVLYLDWETTEFEQRDRAAALATHFGLDDVPDELIYRPQYRSIVEDIPIIRRQVEQEGVRLVVVDSLLPAAGNDAKDEMTAAQTMNALRSLGTDVSRLVLTHMTKAAAVQTNGVSSPYGNAMWRNLSRSVWEARVGGGSREEGAATVGMYHVKVNRGAPRPAVGLSWTFNKDKLPCAVQRTDVRTDGELAARLPARERILYHLRRGPASVQDMAEALDIPEMQVRARLSDLEKATQVVKLGPGRGAPWGLAARHHEG